MQSGFAVLPSFYYSSSPHLHSFFPPQISLAAHSQARPENISGNTTLERLYLRCFRGSGSKGRSPYHCRYNALTKQSSPIHKYSTKSFFKSRGVKNFGQNIRLHMHVTRRVFRKINATLNSGGLNVYNFKIKLSYRIDHCLL